MSAVTHQVHIRAEAFEVACLACDTAESVGSGTAELQQFVDAHWQPVLRTLYVRVDGGPITVWHCRQPKSLR